MNYESRFNTTDLHYFNTIIIIIFFSFMSFLVFVGLSGNPIKSFLELEKLSFLPNLIKLSLNDIHHGNCPVSVLDGYREFVICHLKQVKFLDGILINKNHQINANLIRDMKVEIINIKKIIEKMNQLLILRISHFLFQKNS